MKIEHEFWIERSTQAVWAIELHDDVVTACYGPLLPEDVEDDLLETFVIGDPTDAASHCGLEDRVG